MVHWAGPPELSPAPFPMRGPGCSGAGQGLNFPLLLPVRCGAGRENLAPPRLAAITSLGNSFLSHGTSVPPCWSWLWASRAELGSCAGQVDCQR